jgi:hypothetical protein
MTAGRHWSADVTSVLDLKNVIAEPGGPSIIDYVNPMTERGAYSGETLDEIRKNYPRAEIVDIDEWLAARAAEQDTPVTWYETTAEEFDRMLGVLPPAYLSGATFAVGERATTPPVRVRRGSKRTGRPRPATFARRVR